MIEAHRRWWRRWARTARTRVRCWRHAVAALLVGALALPPLTLGVGGSREAAATATLVLVMWGSALMALLLGSGGYASGRRSGTAVLWLQKPVDGSALYLHRLVGRLAATLLVILLLVAAASLGVGVVDLPVTAGQMAGAATTMVLVGSLLVCVTWAVSGWGLSPEPLLSAVVFGGLSALTLIVAVNPDSLGSALPAARLVGIPLDALDGAGRDLAAGSAGKDLVVVLAYAAGWVAFGTLGTAVTTRSPLRGGRQ